MLRYEELIKSMATDVDMKVVLENRETKSAAGTIPEGPPDGLEGIRRVLSDIVAERRASGDAALSRVRTVVLTRRFARERDAQQFFARAGDTLEIGARQMDAAAERMTAEERVRALRHFFRPHMDGRSLPETASWRRIHAWAADAICPDSLVIEPSHIELDGRYARALYVRDFPARMDDTLIADIMELPREMLVTADYCAKSKEEAMRILNRHKDRVEADIRKRTVTSGREGNWNASIPRHLEEEREALDRFFTCISTQDQRIVMTQITIVHMAESLDELNQDTDAIRAAGTAKGADIGVLRYRQEQGMLTALPIGADHVRQRRMLSSENTSFFIPFRTKEILEPGGIVYGVNEISNNLVAANRMEHKNGNGFIVGDAGGGKSLLAKYELMCAAVQTSDDLIVLDPDGEYGRIVRWLGGEVVRVAADSRDAINMMDMPDELDAGDDPIALKCGFVSGAADIMMRGAMTAAGRSVTDRCVRAVLLRSYESGGRPTLADVYAELLAQREPAAAEVALAMEIYATGSLNVFSRQTSADIQGRLVCFDIRDLGAHMRDLGMMVVLDAIDRRVAANRRRGRHTWIWCDEIWSLLKYPQTEEYMWGFWKRCRKYGGLPTGITQSLSALCASVRGREMIANSEFVFMFGASAEDRETAAELFSLSEDQRAYLAGAAPGHGLLRAGTTVIPLDATVPMESEFYRVATTRLLEVVSGNEVPDTRREEI